MRTEPSWSALLTPRLILPLAVLLGGNLLHSMNLLITATLLPSIVADIGGARLMSWPRPPSLPPRLLRDRHAGRQQGDRKPASVLRRRRDLCNRLGLVRAGAFYRPDYWRALHSRSRRRLLSALAYVLVRTVFAEPLWPRVFGPARRRLVGDGPG